MFSDDERRQLANVGYSILVHIAGATSYTYFYGTFVSLFSLSTFFVLSRSDKSRTTWAVFGATILSFLIATLYWAANVSFFAIYIQKAFVEGIEGPLDNGYPYDTDPRVVKTNEMMDWSLQALQMVNDVIVLWRASVLCPNRRWLVLGPLALLLGTCATSLAFLGKTANVNTLESYFRGERDTHALLYATGALSLATNASSVLLIVYLLWLSRMSWNVGSRSRWSHAQKILLMIVESGAVYGLCQLAAVLSIKREARSRIAIDYFKLVVWEAYIQTTAMYPTVVLLLIETKRSFADMDFVVATSLRDAVQIGKGAV